MAAEPKFRLIATNDLPEEVMASMASADGSCTSALRSSLCCGGRRDGRQWKIVAFDVFYNPVAPLSCRGDRSSRGGSEGVATEWDEERECSQERRK